MAGCISSTAAFACNQCVVGQYIDTTCKTMIGCSATTGTTCSSCASKSTTTAGVTTVTGGYVDAFSASCTACTTTNCLSCSAAATCTQCKAGFYLKSATECAVFASCTESTSNACSKCDAGYVIATDALSCLVCGSGSESYGKVFYVAGLTILAIFSAMMIWFLWFVEKYFWYYIFFFFTGFFLSQGKPSKNTHF